MPRVEGSGRTVLACPTPAASTPPNKPAPEPTIGRRYGSWGTAEDLGVDPKDLDKALQETMKEL
jgi:hypothetical protein